MMLLPVLLAVMGVGIYRLFAGRKAVTA